MVNFQRVEAPYPVIFNGYGALYLPQTHSHANFFKIQLDKWIYRRETKKLGPLLVIILFFSWNIGWYTLS